MLMITNKYGKSNMLPVTSSDGIINYHIEIPKVLVWLIGCLTQKGQFLPSAGKGNRLSWLRMANEIQCI